MRIYRCLGSIALRWRILPRARGIVLRCPFSIPGIYNSGRLLRFCSLHQLNILTSAFTWSMIPFLEVAKDPTTQVFATEIFRKGRALDQASHSSSTIALRLSHNVVRWEASIGQCRQRSVGSAGEVSSLLGCQTSQLDICQMCPDHKGSSNFLLCWGCSLLGNECCNNFMDFSKWVLE